MYVRMFFMYECCVYISDAVLISVSATHSFIPIIVHSSSVDVYDKSYKI